MTREEEQSGDLISRQKALLSLTGEDLPKDRDKYIALVNKRIKALPSVKQEPKTGHWIMTGDYLTTAYSSIDYVKCSCCNEYSLEEGDYCPNCGARMESEEKE